MDELFDLITKLRIELESCRTGKNDKPVNDALVTINRIDNCLLKQEHRAFLLEITIGINAPFYYAVIESDKDEAIKKARDRLKLHENHKVVVAYEPLEVL